MAERGEVRIEVEPVEPGEPGGAATGGSSRHVVQEPSRGIRAVAVVALAGLVAAGLAWGLGTGAGDDRPSPDRPPPEAGPDADADADPASASDDYRQAVARLGRAHSFAFHGTVQSDERSPLRPGTWLERTTEVQGAVLLPHSITRELAVAANGGEVVETVTSGAIVWSRTAADRAALAGAPWEVVDGTDDASWRSGGRRGIALVAEVLQAAVEPRRGRADADGRRPLRATVPANDVVRAQVGDVLAGAELTVELDGAGDIDHVVVRAGPDAGDDAPLVADLTIERLGEDDLITPADVGRPARTAVQGATLEDAGAQLLEPARLPAGWALTAAGDTVVGPVVRCGGAGRCKGPDGCATLDLRYHDLTAVSDGWLTLTVQPDGCVVGAYAEGVADLGAPLTAGRFSGWVDETSAQTMGAVSDGRTAVIFATDLAAADAAALLATLAPFDPASEPAVLPGVPSS